jgi:hypothetical protein
MRHRDLGLRCEQACPRLAVKSCAQIQDSAEAVVTGVKVLKKQGELVVNGFGLAAGAGNDTIYLGCTAECRVPFR